MATNRLARAKAAKVADVASAVAKAVSSPTLRAVDSTLKRQQLLLPADLVLESRERLFGMLRDGTPASFSQLAEIALRELFVRPDFEDVVARYGTSARRPGPG